LGASRSAWEPESMLDEGTQLVDNGAEHFALISRGQVFGGEGRIYNVVYSIQRRLGDHHRLILLA